MKNKLFLIMVLLIAASLIFSACQPAPAPETPAEAPAVEEPAAAEATEVPATEAPAAPEPTAVPVVEKVLTVVNGPTDVNSIDPSILQDTRARQIANSILWRSYIHR